MADPITAGALGLGVLFLILWYTTETRRRATRLKRTVGSLTKMTDDDHDDDQRASSGIGGLPALLMSDLPPRLDEEWVERRVMQNIEVFRATDGLLEGFLFNLRDRYRSRWELEMLERVEKKLAAQVRVMELGAHHAAVRRTLHERTETEMFETRTKHFDAKEALERAQSRSEHVQRKAKIDAEIEELESDNRLLKARQENQRLRRQVDDAEKPKPERISEEQAAYERGKRRKSSENAEQKGIFDGDEEFREKMRRECDEKIAAANADPTLTDDEKSKRTKYYRTQYAKFFAREY